MRAVLYDADWQLLRINCLAARNTDGGWGTLVGTDENLQMMLKYLYEVLPSDEGHLRRYRVNNCLNAVVMGYNGQGASYELIQKVRWFRNNYVSLGTWDKATVARYSDGWIWWKQTDKLKVWKEEDLHFLLENLKKRAQKGSDRTRPELHKFIGCIRVAIG
jgi:hypothetical protein